MTDYYLDTNREQRFFGCSFKQFLPREKHCERTADYDVLLLMLRGTLRFTEDGVSVELHPGEYYVQRAFLCQNGDDESDLPYYFYVHFYGAYTEDKTGMPLRGVFSEELLKPDIGALEEAFESPFADYIDRSICFYRILSDLRLRCSRDGFGVARLAKNYIDTHFAGELSLTALEDQLNYSHDYIIREFRREFGTTPYRYLTWKRVEYAKRRLALTDAKVSQISRDLGYRDDSGFYRAFYSATGETPMRWKEDHAENNENAK